jgi:hypothetical protein
MIQTMLSFFAVLLVAVSAHADPQDAVKTERQKGFMVEASKTFGEVQKPKEKSIELDGHIGMVGQKGIGGWKIQGNSHFLTAGYENKLTSSVGRRGAYAGVRAPAGNGVMSLQYRMGEFTARCPGDCADRTGNFKGVDVVSDHRFFKNMLQITTQLGYSKLSELDDRYQKDGRELREAVPRGGREMHGEIRPTFWSNRNVGIFGQAIYNGYNYERIPLGLGESINHDDDHMMYSVGATVAF